MRSILLLPALLLLPAASVAAGDSALDRATLRGLTSVNVVIDPLPQELIGEGVRPDDLQTRLEGRLQNAGIQVDPNAREFLALRLLHTHQKKGPYAVSITVALYQPVLLVRDQKVRTATGTWQVETVIYSDRRQLYQAITDSLEELANGFITAFRAVNPQ